MGLFGGSHSKTGPSMVSACTLWAWEGFSRTLQCLAFSLELLKTKSHRFILLRAPQRYRTSPREQEQLFHCIDFV